MKSKHEACSPKPELIVALDVDTYEKAEKLVETLYPEVKFFKIGNQLFTKSGPSVVKMVKDYGAEVFLDLKFFDIPNTVAGAVISATGLSVNMINLHSLGGEEMMRAAKLARDKEAKRLDIKPPILLAVTALTSEKQTGKITSCVLDLAKRAKASGLDGVICSAREAKEIRRHLGDDFIIVTPGIRPKVSSLGDQKRVSTPREASDYGVDFIIVGRPIIKSRNPRRVALKILKEIE